MIINEQGLVRAIKRAYKNGGFTIINHGGQVTAYTDGWYVRVDWDKLPRKALAAIVECMGTLPATPEALAIEKDMEPQVVMPEQVGQEIADWEAGEDEPGAYTVTPARYADAILYQEAGGGACYGVRESDLAIVDVDVRKNKEATRKGAGRIYWSHDGELVILEAIRPAGAYWTRDWEKKIWEAFESVDLHRQPE